MLPGLHVARRVRDEDVERLGGADPVENLETGGGLPAAEELRGQRLAGRHAQPERPQIGTPLPRRRATSRGAGRRSRRVQRLQLGRVQRRHAEVGRRTQRLDRLERRRGGRTPLVEDRGASHPQREGHRVPETVREEELRRGVATVVLAQPQDAHRVVLAGRGHVAVAVRHSLGTARGARRVEPERDVLRPGWRRLQLRSGRSQIVEHPAPRHEHEPADAGSRRRQPRHDFGRELRRVDDGPALRVGDDEREILRPHEVAHGYGHDPRLDRPPEEMEELGAVLHEHQHAVARRDPEPEERVPRPRNPLGQFRVRDRPPGLLDGDLATPSLSQVPVDIPRGRVERLPVPETRGDDRTIDSHRRLSATANEGPTRWDAKP